TMSDISIILADGTCLDSSSTSSRENFGNKRPDIINGLKELSAIIHSDKQLLDLITRKYEIKNTVGYSLNALIDFNDPINMLTHLLVGSEGTLGFVTSVTYNSVDDHPHKATALVPFASNHMAAKGVQALHKVGVSAAEFMERKALAKVEHLPAMAAFKHILGENSPAVLIEIMADSDQKLNLEINAAIKAMQKIGTLSTPDFTKDPNIQSGLWDIRKGMFASVGAIRPKGSLMLTEDLAVPIDRLADVVDDLRFLLDKHQYHEGVIFGHALAGNLHFQMHGDFTQESELRRFADLGADLSDLISIKYKGSLKAEHGTGRAIAPFVEAEWGKKAYEIMHQIKQLLDPQNILNPGVLLNDNKNAHIQNTKHMVTSDDLVDLCVECGVCEPVCPSAGFTLTPRQRIAVNREQAHLENSGENNRLLSELNFGFSSAVMDTCAGCSLCATLCPIGIDTGAMVLNKRSQQTSSLSKRIAALAAANTPLVENISKIALSSLRLLPSDLSKNLPTPPQKPKRGEINHQDKSKDVIYFPACPSRIFGAAKTSLDLLPLTKAMPILLKRAGFNPILPNKTQGLCCGQPFVSKGFPKEAKQVGEKLGVALNEIKNNRQIKIITDASTCAKHMNQNDLQTIDSVEFLLKEVVPRLEHIRPIENLAVHLNCASKTTKGSSHTKTLAQICSKNIAVLNSVTCCGYAGDKGIFQPKLNAHALRFAAIDLPENCKIGISTVSTCAIGLTKHLQIPFVSLASILEYVSRSKS
ncbi:Predicted D-lactate dehydrogenase, Fe-S protein, FAD/FMN-containing, partial [hydrothermal vent metagenome]